MHAPGPSARGVPPRGTVPGSPVVPPYGIPRGPRSRSPPWLTAPISHLALRPRLSRAPQTRGLPRAPPSRRPPPPRRPPSGVLQGKGVQIVCRSTSNTRRRHHPSKGMLFNPPHFYNVHGPVRNGVLPDIVLVDPHMHACAHGFTTSQQ